MINRDVESKQSSATSVLSPIKASKRKLFVQQNISENGKAKQNSDLKEKDPSMRRQASNVDISEVYEDKHSVSSAKLRGATATDFMVTKKNPVQVAMEQ